MQTFRGVLDCLFWVLLGCVLVTACHPTAPLEVTEGEELPLSYAEGFSVQRGEDFWVITVKQAFPGAQESFRYLVLNEGARASVTNADFDAVIQLPISSVIVTSTTHVPHLDYLGATESLKAFPSLDLISSEQTRARIDAGYIQDLGNAPSANLEMILDLSPDWIMISTLGENLDYLKILKSGGVPAVLNGEYVEQHPLGRAEWIKFTGVLLGKWDEAVSVFETIEKRYQETLAILPSENLSKPTVLSGVMYKDSWYMPGSDSWGARLLREAGGDYLFQDQKGTGSSQLSYEVVLDRAKYADLWIGAADFPTLRTMGVAEPRYRQFESWKKGQVYTYTQKRGAKGGLEYFELGYLRPDLIVKDLMIILHPELFPGESMYFYQKLNE